jgi:F0F1-type ATP synthase epsilon subunit
VSKIVSDALAANPGITASDVSKIVSDALAANPGITADQVKSAVDGGIAGVKTDLASVTAAQQAAAQQAAQQAAAQAASDTAAKANAAKAQQGQRANSVLAVLSLMQGQQTAQQAAQSNTPYVPPPVVDIGNQLDLGSPLQTNPFAKQKTATKMARGGSIDDLLAILKRG